MRKVRREVTRKLILAAVIGEPNAVSNAIGYAMVESRQSHITEAQRKRSAAMRGLSRLDSLLLELGGGSARCMIATIHLPPRS